ncbi:hypothetical protein LINPERPRIM_LOCUS25925 [Linum perenne]
MTALGFPCKMVNWIKMTCSSSQMAHCKGFLLYIRTRRKSLRECTPSQNYSWIWNKLLKTRDEIGCFVTFDADGDPLWNGSLMFKFSVSTI